MEEEIWKTITNFEDYEVSSEGRIRVTETGKIIKQFLNADPYYEVVLINSSGKRYESVTHRIVAKAFCLNDDPEHKVIVDHLDNNSLNNKASNLEWVTQKENLRRARERDGHKPRKKVSCKCIQTGKIYSSIAEASKDTGIRYYSVWSSVTKHRPIHGFEFIDLSQDSNCYKYDYKCAESL